MVFTDLATLVMVILVLVVAPVVGLIMLGVEIVKFRATAKTEESDAEE